jgi:hypothetical protein
MPYSKLCKVCNCEHSKDVLNLVSQGWGSTKILSFLSEKGHYFTKNQIDNHIKKHIEIVKTEVVETIGTPESKKDRTKRIQEEIEQIQITIPPIPENCSFPQLVDWVQKSTGRIFLKQLAIVEASQDMFLRGEIRHPSEQIRGLKDLSHVLDLIFAYRTGTDLTRAIQVIENEGYDIIDNSQSKQLPGKGVQEPGNENQ